MSIEEENIALKKELAERNKWRRIEAWTRVACSAILLIIFTIMLIKRLKYG